MHLPVPATLRFEFMPWETRTQPANPFADTFTRAIWRGEERLIWLKAHDGFLWCRVDGEDARWNFAAGTNYQRDVPFYGKVEHMHRIFHSAFQQQELGRVVMVSDKQFPVWVGARGNAHIYEKELSLNREHLGWNSIPFEEFLKWSSFDCKQKLDRHWNEQNSTFSKALHFAALSVHERLLLQVKFIQGFIQEMEHVWRWLVLCDPAVEEAAHEYINAEKVRVFAALRCGRRSNSPTLTNYELRTGNNFLEIAPTNRRLLDYWIWHFYPTVNEDFLKEHKFLSTYTGTPIYISFWHDYSPTAHEKLEALFNLRAWLRGKVADEEIERLLGD